ncbi:hypothetical protein, partial [Tritonibacter mobilis]|uniref:hypothetical protein n=1 Tax=Tritonibacter mobilis TaxID=379347 RepID=UPI0014024121
KQTAQSKLAYFYAALMDQFCTALDTEALSKAARIKAEAAFPWAQVAQSWYAAALGAHDAHD